MALMTTSGQQFSILFFGTIEFYSALDFTSRRQQYVTQG